jgi:hypothetical protein
MIGSLDTIMTHSDLARKYCLSPFYSYMLRTFVLLIIALDDDVRID